MKNFLRFSFVAVMMMLFGNVMAEEVVVKFVPAETKATATTTEVSKDGITLSVTGGTMNRDDNYRVNKSQTLTVTSTIGNIKMITFTSTVDNPSDNYGAKFDVENGTFVADGATGTWIGDAAVVKLTATDHQVRATEFIIVVDSNGTTPGNNDNPGGSSNLLSLFTFKSGSFSETENQLVFDFSGVAVLDQTTGATIEVSGKFDFVFENNLCTSNTLSLTLPDEATAAAAWAAISQNAEQDGYTNINLDGKTLSATLKDFIGISKIVIKSMLKLMLKDEEDGKGTLESPLTPNLANILAGSLANKEITEYDVYIKGKVASITEPFGAQYGNATFYISIDGKEDFTFYVYRALYLENQKWVEGNTELKVGDDVIVCGKLTNYSGTPETAQGKAYIYSLNGKTKNEGGSDNPDTPKEITVAKALEIIAALEDGKTTSEEYVVKGIVTKVDEISTSYGNATFDIADTAGGATVLKVYRAKDAEGQKITDENIVKVGDEVVVQGKLQKYVKNDVVTPEVAQNGKILTVNGQSTGITVVKAAQAEAPLYNLAGQRVDANYKGVVIKNGQKMIQK